ncbi:DUF6715 family protein [Anaerosporobacter sp.]
MAVSKKERRNKWLIVVIGTIILVALYIFLVNRDTKKAEQEDLAEQVQNVIGTDLEIDYPSTPREVIIKYNEIIACYYENKLDDDTIKKIMAQQRVLFDQELLEQNPIDSQLKDLKEELLDYQKNNRKFITSAVAKSSSVTYWSKDDRDYASIIATYTLKDSEVTKTYERYILRKDDQEKWRILGWQMTSPTDLDK